MQYAAGLMRRLPATGAGALIVALATGIFLYSAPATYATSSCTGWKSTVVPPPSINVLRTRLGRVDTVPFRRYVEVVMAAEWGPGTAQEALAAGAVAVKQYAWYFALAGHWRGGTAGGVCFDVRDTTADQVYHPATKTPTPGQRAAVAESWAVTLRKPGGDPGGRFFMTSYNSGGALRACGAGATGRTLLQHGAATCGAQGYTFESILRIYYGSDVQVVMTGQNDLDGGGFGDVGVFVDGEGTESTEALLLHSNGRTLTTRSDQVVSFGPTDALGRLTVDLTGDRRADLVVLVEAAGGPQLRVFPATGSGFGPAQLWWDGAVQDPRLTPEELSLVSADWNADGRADLGLVAPAPGKPQRARLYTMISTGSGLQPARSAWTGPADLARTSAFGGDFNGDGRGDLALVEDRGAHGVALRVLASRPTGGGFAAPTDWYVERRLARLDVIPLAADIDGDGRNDLVFVARDGTTPELYLYRGGAHAFTRSDLGPGPAGSAWSARAWGTADLDRDGAADLVALVRDGEGLRVQGLLSRGGALVATDWGGETDRGWAGATAY
jgi:Stage II sporulation protein/FG-GAP-like repeat